MEFSELIRRRESVRNYDPTKPVPRDMILKILEAGRLAPSAANKQPWKFVVLTSPEALEKIHRAYDKTWFHDAPCVLAVTGNRKNAWVRGIDGYCSIETDLGIAMTHIVLSAANEGVGSCWIANFNPAIVRETLQLKDDEVVYALTPLGFPKPDYTPKNKKERKPLDDIVQWL